MDTILPYKYPTTTLFLDDEESFLESLKMLLFKPEKNLIFTMNPDQALNAINDSNEENYSNFKLDYSKFANLTKNPYRMQEISVIVVDYHMPKTDGITFCKQIKNSKCQKILLTAEQDQKLAIHAFNQGIIHQYISKQDENVDNLLISAIEQAENRFFADKFSNMILSAKYGDIYFKNHNFQKFLIDFFAKNNIIEHYIFGENGNLFCIASDGITYKIFIKTKEEIQIPLTWQEADYLPTDTLFDLKSCKKMLCFSMNEQEIPHFKDWSKYLALTIPLPNEPNYFISVLKNHPL